MFNQIPIDLLTPGQYIEFASVGAFSQRHRVLVFGQKLSAGTAVADAPVQVLTKGSINTLAGQGSQLANMAHAVLGANPNVELWLVPLADPTTDAVAATATITLTGTATESGSLVVWVAGRRLAVAVSKGATAATVATNLKAAMDANKDLIVTGAASAGVITLTCRHKGELGNALDLRTLHHSSEVIPAGLSVTLEAFGDGAGVVDITDGLTACAEMEFTSIVVPDLNPTTTDALEAELERRWGPLVQLASHAFAAVAGSAEDMVAALEDVNLPWLTVMAAGASPTPTWEWAAVAAAVDESEGDPARPRQTLELMGAVGAREGERLPREDRQTLLENGIATHVVDAQGKARIERLVTTYTEDPSGNLDARYRDIEVLRNLAYQSWYVRTRIGSKFARHKLASDGQTLVPGQPVVTPSILRAELVAIYREFEAVGLVEGLDAFVSALRVERDGSDPSRVNAFIPPDLVNGLRVFAAQIQFTV